MPTPPTPGAGTLAQRIEQEATNRVRLQLGLKVGDPLPSDVAKAIKNNAAAAATDVLNGSIKRDTANIGRELEQAGVFDRFLVQANVAKNGLAKIAGSPDINDILKKRAELLAAKVAALEAVKFSRAEAMQILLGDIAARS